MALTLDRLVPPRLDVAVAVVFMALAVMEFFVNRDVRSPEEYLVAVGAMALIAWRRRFPVAVAFLVVVSNILTNPDGEFTVLLSLVLVSFTTGAELDPPMRYVGLAVVVVPFIA